MPGLAREGAMQAGGAGAEPAAGGDAASTEPHGATAVDPGTEASAGSEAGKQAAGEGAKGPVVRDIRALDAPVALAGEVVHGFGRGSKVLGIPTANLSSEALGARVDDIAAGVYFGWATVSGYGAAPFKAVLSVGWNPYFKNKTKTVEPHLLHTFDADFYGEELRLLITGFLRPEADFPSLESLIDAIKTDIAVASEALDREPYVALREHAHFARTRATSIVDAEEGTGAADAGASGGDGGSGSAVDPTAPAASGGGDGGGGDAVAEAPADAADAPAS